jgi:hypothetical protein
LGAGPGGAYFLVNGLIVNPSLTTIGGSATPGATGISGGGAPGQPPVVSIINTGNRNVAALTPLDAKRFLRLTTPVRQNITTVRALGQAAARWSRAATRSPILHFAFQNQSGG